MSELNSAEQTALATRMRDGVPEAPDISDLAARAQTRARRVRRTRRVSVIVAAAVAVVTVAAVPRLVGKDDAPSSVPAPAPARCVSEARLDHQDFRTGTAAWVRACPEKAPGGHIPMPPGTVRGQAAADLVAAWQRGAAHYDVQPNCGLGSPPSTAVQVGFTDGTVAELDAVGCFISIHPGPLGILGLAAAGLADPFTTAMHRQNDERYPTYNPPGPPRECPRHFSDPARMNIDGASTDELSSSGPLLDLTAVDSLVCRYDDGRLTDTRRNRDPERLLLASDDQWQSPYRHIRHNLSGLPWYQHPLGSYLVTLRDKTDTWRTFTITGRYGFVRLFRGAGVVTRLGYAGPELYRAVGAHPG